MHKPRTLLVALLLISAAWLHAADEVLEHHPAGLPIITNYSGEVTILVKEYWTHGWDAGHMNAVWTCYYLPDRDRNFPEPGSHNGNFERDPSAPGNPDPSLDAFGDYDRGHIVPNNAMNLLFGAVAQAHSYLISNATPQPSTHNRGVWRSLENWTLQWSQIHGGAWVITGVTYDDIEEELTGGMEIPDAWYQIVVVCDDDGWDAIAFLVPEDLPLGRSAEKYITTIRDIEAVAGLDFFSQWPDGLEDELESIEAEVWALSPREIDRPLGIDPININAASADDLMRLPGIGESFAERIIAGRPYESVDSILEVRGIGEILLSRIREYITVE